MYFDNIPNVKYEGKDSKDPYAFKYYNPSEIIGNKTMKEHLRFSIAYWHSFLGRGVDIFGEKSYGRKWDINCEIEASKQRIEAFFEFAQVIDIDYFCFHDRDLITDMGDLKQTNRALDEVVDILKKNMQKNGIKLLWGTANLFYSSKYVHGAATSCNADVFAYAAAQTKKAIEVTKELNGENFVFWGGREGYDTLLNTNMLLEQNNMAKFLEMAVEYAHKIGFKGQFLIEPKPKEPLKHQYDYDVSTVISFLQKYNLDRYFKINVENNHATLACHTFEHELQIARINGMLGSIDANQGDSILGWDTDHFSCDVKVATLAMIEVLRNGGISPGGINFDAKLRRASIDLSDLVFAHILAMDTYAKGLRVAFDILESNEIEDIIKERYKSFSYGIGEKIVNREVGFLELETYAINNKHIKLESGKEELIESIINRYLFR